MGQIHFYIEETLKIIVCLLFLGVIGNILLFLIRFFLEQWDSLKDRSERIIRKEEIYQDTPDE